jgi:hypothetical protein
MRDIWWASVGRLIDKGGSALISWNLKRAACKQFKKSGYGFLDLCSTLLSSVPCHCVPNGVAPQDQGQYVMLPWASEYYCGAGLYRNKPIRLSVPGEMYHRVIPIQSFQSGDSLFTQ